MHFEWDETKRAANLAKHALDFADAGEFDWDAAAIIADERFEYKETRYRAFAAFRGRLHTISFTLREDTYRIISFRRANERERKRYGTPIT